MLGFDLKQATNLLTMFGGAEADITVDHLPNGHTGTGLYAWHTEYPDEGFVLLGNPPPKKPADGARPPAGSGHKPQLLLEWGRFRAIETWNDRRKQLIVRVEVATTDRLGEKSWSDANSTERSTALELLFKQACARKAPADKSTPLGRFTVFEVGQDGPDRHGILLRAADLSTFFIPCDKETARLAGEHLMEDVELLFRPEQ